MSVCLEKLAWDKHSSLFQKIVNYGQKSFITLGPGRKLLLTRRRLYWRRSARPSCWRRRFREPNHVPSKSFRIKTSSEREGHFFGGGFRRPGRKGIGLNLPDRFLGLIKSRTPTGAAAAADADGPLADQPWKLFLALWSAIQWDLGPML